MTAGEKPTLTIVAGTDGSTQGPYSNVARIVDVATKMQGIRKRKRGRPRKNVPKDADVDLTEERARAYSDMEPFLCDCVRMGRIAQQLFDNPDRELYDFAVNRVAEMLEELRERYYANGWR
jgi:hypothetical protein